MRISLSCEPLDFPPQPPSERGRLQLLPPTRIIAEEAVPDEPLTLSDIRQFALYLAREFKHNVAAAQSQPPAWYREQAGPELCPEKQAELLREMTIECCDDVAVLQRYIAENSRSLRSERLDGISFVFALVFLFTVFSLLFGQEVPGPEYPTTSSQTVSVPGADR